MTKRKFYIIKTLVATGLAIYIYFCIDAFKKNQITYETSDLEVGFLSFSVVVAVIIFLIGIKFLINYQRPKFPE